MANQRQIAVLTEQLVR